MNIVIFDEHPAILDSVSNFFSQKEGFRIGGIFSSKSDLVRYMNTYHPKIIITEFICSDEGGLSWVCQIRKINPSSKIIVFSAHNPHLEYNLIRSGADAFVNKKSTISTLHNIIVDLCSQELEYRREKPVAKYLTKKERSIVLQMIEGATSNDIAQKMDCSIHTINNQKNHLIKKFNCNTSPELVAKLFRMGYIKI